MTGNGWFFVAIGALLLIVGNIYATDGNLQLIVYIAGGAVLLYGVYGLFQRSRDRDEHGDRTLGEKVLLECISRMASSDSNVHPVEVETICRVFTSMTGKEATAAEVRTLAGSELYESVPFASYLAGVAGKLGEEDRRRIAKALCEVIAADGHHNPLELDFFNRTVRTLKLDPSDIAHFGAAGPAKA